MALSSFSQRLQLSRFPFIRDVVIVDAGNRNGVPVKIESGGWTDPPIVGDGGAETSSMSYTRHLFIKRQAETPNFGEIDLQFGPSFLELATAGIAEGNIVWKFNPPQKRKHSGNCHASWRNRPNRPKDSLRNPRLLPSFCPTRASDCQHPRHPQRQRDLKCSPR